MTTTNAPQEVELKLAVAVPDPARLPRLLAALPLLAGHKPLRQRLYNIYHDTPEQALRRARAALRLRRIGSGAKAQWLQTLKLGGRGDAALSRRGEWEDTVAAPRLDPGLLRATPWAGLDPDGALFGALGACFVTDFERTLWTLRWHDGSVVEVALDLGRIEAEGRTEALCELELELREGRWTALFEVAAALAQHLPLLPLAASKSARGYALGEGTEARPRHAQPPALDAGVSVAGAVQPVLREMFGQFTANLLVLQRSDDSEAVHQARVGWRRWRSALRLFGRQAGLPPTQPREALRPLLDALRALREADVARGETLPGLAEAFAGGDAARGIRWQAAADLVAQAAHARRAAARQALASPPVGAALLATAYWLETLGEPEARAAAAERVNGVDGVDGVDDKGSLRDWARDDIPRLYRKLRKRAAAAATPAEQHRVRLLAKRLRYGIEALLPVLPPRRAQAWLRHAASIQDALGAARDVEGAAALLAALDADREVTGFLRGVAAGAPNGPAPP